MHVFLQTPFETWTMFEVIVTFLQFHGIVNDFNIVRAQETQAFLSPSVMQGRQLLICLVIVQ